MQGAAMRVPSAAKFSSRRSNTGSTEFPIQPQSRKQGVIQAAQPQTHHQNDVQLPTHG